MLLDCHNSCYRYHIRMNNYNKVVLRHSFRLEMVLEFYRLFRDIPYTHQADRFWHHSLHNSYFRFCYKYSRDLPVRRRRCRRNNYFRYRMNMCRYNIVFRRKSLMSQMLQRYVLLWGLIRYIALPDNLWLHLFDSNHCSGLYS